jgi:hypothetical protein
MFPSRHCQNGCPAARSQRHLEPDANQHQYGVGPDRERIGGPVAIRTAPQQGGRTACLMNGQDFHHA